MDVNNYIHWDSRPRQPTNGRWGSINFRAWEDAQLAKLSEIVENEG